MNVIDHVIAEHCPNGVPFERLRDVGTWYGGGTPSKAVAEYWENGSIPWLSPKDMTRGTLEATEDLVSELAVQSSAVKLVPAGSVAFVVRSNILRRRMPVALVPFAVTLNQDMRAVVPRDGVLLEYLAQVCRASADAIRASAGRTDGSMAAIRGPELLEFRIPVPPPAVQQEIAGILSRMEGLEAELEAELEFRSRQYAHYLDSLLTFAGRDQVRWAKLSELGQFLRGKRFTKADYEDAGIPCIHYGEIYTHFGASATSVVSHIRRDIASGLRYAEPGDVVIVDVGETVEDVGKAMAWLGDEPVAIHDHSYAFRHDLNPAFVSYVMMTSWFRREKVKYIARTKVNTLLVDGFSRIEIPVPSLDEQELIVSILDKFDALVNDLSVGLPAEIRARRAQYEHYRDRLLSFEEAARR